MSRKAEAPGSHLRLFGLSGGLCLPGDDKVTEERQKTIIDMIRGCIG